MTQKNIAEAAGVSRKTVSRFVNDAGQVAAQTRKKIEAACRKLNYMPNHAARTIRTGRFKRIACLQIRKIEPDGRESVYQHQLQYINGMTRYLSAKGFALELDPVIVDQSGDSEKIYFPQMFSEHCVDGIICLPFGVVWDTIRDKLGELHLPRAWINNSHPPQGWGCMLFDECSGTRKLTRHLIEKGFKNIVWFSGQMKTVPHYSEVQRLQGFVDTLKEAGLRHDMAFFMPRGWDRSESAVNLLQRYPDVDAIIANVEFFWKSDAFLEAERKLGRRVEIGKVTSEWFVKDNAGPGAYMVIPESEMGARAAQYVLSGINGCENKELLEPLEPKLHVNGRYVA